METPFATAETSLSPTWPPVKPFASGSVPLRAPSLFDEGSDGSLSGTPGLLGDTPGVMGCPMQTRTARIFQGWQIEIPPGDCAEYSRVYGVRRRV